MRIDAEPALAQAADQVEHLRGLRDAERGGGLVEDHELRLAEQRAGDRDRLALAAGEHADLGAHRAQRAHRERVEQLARALLHRDLVDRHAADRAAGLPRARGTGSSTTSRLSHSARSW